MLAEVGFVATLIAFGVALYAALIALCGARTHAEHLVRSARNAAIEIAVALGWTFVWLALARVARSGRKRAT